MKANQIMHLVFVFRIIKKLYEVMFMLGWNCCPKAKKTKKKQKKQREYSWADWLDLLICIFGRLTPTDLCMTYASLETQTDLWTGPV